jgi:hypothetical protein
MVTDLFRNAQDTETVSAGDIIFGPGDVADKMYGIVADRFRTQS